MLIGAISFVSSVELKTSGGVWLARTMAFQRLLYWAMLASGSALALMPAVKWQLSSGCDSAARYICLSVSNAGPPSTAPPGPAAPASDESSTQVSV